MDIIIHDSSGSIKVVVVVVVIVVVIAVVFFVAETATAIGLKRTNTFSNEDFLIVPMHVIMHLHADTHIHTTHIYSNIFADSRQNQVLLHISPRIYPRRCQLKNERTNKES